MQNATGNPEDILAATLLQLIVIVLVARGASVWLRRIGQPGAVGEILAGLLLGPSFLGAVFPEWSGFVFGAATAAPIHLISQIGLIFLMFQIGSDFNFAHLERTEYRRAVAAVAAASLLAPLALGLLVGRWSAPALASGVDARVYSLFFAVALAITAVPILGRILREFGLTQTPLGVITITAAAVNDVVGWLLLAAVSAVATAHFSPQHLAVQIACIVAFAAVLWLAGRPLVRLLMRRFPIERGQLPNGLMALVIAAMFAAAICTYRLGIFAIFGGFSAGLLFHRYRDFVEAWQRQVGAFVLVLFLPIFFTYTGLRTNVLGLTTPSDWAWCLLVVAVASVAKIVPVYCAARLTGLPRQESVASGVLMNTRALMELVVLNIGLDLGFMPQKVFTMFVIMALVTTLATAPLLRLVLRRSGRQLPAAVEA
jgi:Kef-type K+ transport system membrane component KefB